MKHFQSLLVVSAILFLLSCEGDTVKVTLIDLSKTQVDLLFVSESEGKPQIYAVTDTTFDPIINVVTGLTYGTLGTLDPTWSKDGRKFAFTDLQVAQVGGLKHTNIYIRNMDSTRTIETALRRVTYSPVEVDTFGNVKGILNLRPDWNSDAERIVFISNRDSIFKIFIVSVDNDSLAGDTIPKALTDESVTIDINCQPSFSPDGSKIVYTRVVDGKEEIWSMDTSGANQQQLIANGATINSRPRYSPSGDKILFYSNVTVNGLDSLQIFTMNPNGTGVTQLTTAGNNYDGAWSPDGQQIVYAVRTLAGNGYIYIMNADGTNPRKLLRDKAAYSPIWRP